MGPAGIPAPPAPAPATGRAPINTPFYAVVVNTCGWFWDIFPWIGLVLYVTIIWSIFGGPPPIVVLIAILALLIWFPLYIFWIICDVMTYNSGWWWVLIGTIGYPIGLFNYLWVGRNA